MEKKSVGLSCFIITIILMSTLVNIIPVTLAGKTNDVKGFDKGPSYKNVVPLKKITFVNFDEDSYLDDYAFLSAIPTAVFNDKDKLFSHPLLFYQDEYPINDYIEKSLNAREGIDYFMED